MKHVRKHFFGYMAIALALAMVVSGTVIFANMSGSAVAENETTQTTTVLTSPFTAAVEQVKGSVVGVNNYQRTRSYGNGFSFGFGGFGYGYGNDDSNTGREVLYGTGSGVVIAEGYVMTNYHVVDGATSLEVTTDEATYPAILAGGDESLDVAILKVEGMKLPAVDLGDSDTLRVGDWAICIGNPLSFTGTTTVGVISALNREVTTDTTLDKYGRRTNVTNTMIQTDAAINSGNSGGGMFNTSGELMGIPTMKYSGRMFSSTVVEGIGMCIPVNACKDLIKQVLSGEVTTDSITTKPADTKPETNITSSASAKPRIGVSTYTINSENSGAVASAVLPTGAYISNVEEGSPAQEAGMQVGDIVVDVNDTVITSSNQMVAMLQGMNAGDVLRVKVYRVDNITTAQTTSELHDGEYIDMQIELRMLDTEVKP